MQNFIPSGLSASQRGQCTGMSSDTAVERLGCAGKRLTRATKIGVWDEVSVPQVWAGVKGKARDGYRDWSGGGGLTDEAW
jgi:hypothetical protein